MCVCVCVKETLHFEYECKPACVLELFVREQQNIYTCVWLCVRYMPSCTCYVICVLNSICRESYQCHIHAQRKSNPHSTFVKAPSPSYWLKDCCTTVFVCFFQNWSKTRRLLEKEMKCSWWRGEKWNFQFSTQIFKTVVEWYIHSVVILELNIVQILILNCRWSQ